MSKPSYVYVASSWRNPLQDGVCAILEAAKIPHYDFKNPEGGAGFSWKNVAGPNPFIPGTNELVTTDTYTRLINNPIAEAGFVSDFEAMKKADTFILVLPCGKSAHLELGWAVGAGKKTCILLEDPMQPELMYKMVDHISDGLMDMLDWLGVKD